MTLVSSVVLLGAGASVQAGVPSSVPMTERISQLIDTPSGRYRGTAQALNFTIGAMIAHATARGLSPYAGIDVESLLSAVQALTKRDTAELAPFVGSWASALEVIGSPSSFPPSFKDNWNKAVDSPFPTDLERLFKTAVEAATKTGDSAVFQTLETGIIESLKILLNVGPESVEYLAPLLNADSAPLRIATLNYDRSIEQLADRAGRQLDTGITSWAGRYGWSFSPNADIHLLKLHGSIDWELFWEPGPWDRDDKRMPEPHVRELPYSEMLDHSQRVPAIVFGQGGKLRADGPFLAMLHSFDNMLSNADRLIIVGYSFRDDHINAAVRRWLNTSARELVIIDPSFHEDELSARAFAKQLNRNIREETLQTEGDTSRFVYPLRDGCQVHNVFADEGLRTVLGAGPTLLRTDTGR